MTICSYQRRDAAATPALWHARRRTRACNDPSQDIARKSRVQPEPFLVAQSNRTVVGCARFGFDGHRGWVNCPAVAPEHRRGGIARALMAEGKARPAALGCPKLNQPVPSGNRAVLDLCHRLGYATDDGGSLGKRLIPDL